MAYPLPDAPRSVVRNAADPKQVNRGARLERDQAQRRELVLVEVLRTATGREFLVGLLEDLGLHRATFDPHGSISNFNQGRHNTALELFARVQAAGEAAEQGDGTNLYELMEREARERRRRLDTATDAAHTARATTDEGASPDGEQ